MAYTTINKSTDYFTPKTLTSNAGGNMVVTGVGFQPDMVWLKSRDQAYVWKQYDAVRGVQKRVRTDSTSAEVTISGGLLSYDSDGFTHGTDTDVNDTNTNPMSWNWKAGTSHSGATTGSGTAKTYTASVNTTSGISIIKYVGNGTAGHTIPHNLGVKPAFILFKNLDDGSTNWQGYHKSLGATKTFKINSTDGSATSASIHNDTEPTTSVFTLGSGGDSNANNQNHIAYCFAEKTGYSSIGSYNGNGNNDGVFCYTGTAPAFLLLKEITSGTSDSWFILDNKRNTYNPRKKNLRPNNADAEADSSWMLIDFLSNGFKINDDDAAINESGKNYIYIAFGQSLVGSNNVPCTAR